MGKEKEAVKTPEELKEEKEKAEKDKWLAEYVERKRKEKGEMDLTPNQRAFFPTYMQNLLNTAKMLEERGDMYQALSLYSRIAKDYPETPEAQESRNSILAMAQEMQTEGQTYFSLSLYDKLLKECG